MRRLAATVSVDVDPVDLHLAGYGHTGLTRDPLVFTVAIPRIMELLARTGVRATFFVIARDAASHVSVLAALLRDGHEVASHSLSHPLALTRISGPAQAIEVRESKRELERVLGEPIVGFRAPNFEVDGKVLAALADAGYVYDASSYPTPWLLPARALMVAKGRDPRVSLAMRWWPHSLARLPHRVGTRGRELVEYPLSVTPITRFPVYHTTRYRLGQGRFERLLRGFVSRAEPLSYPVHAVDALGAVEDRVDPRLTSHPGMALPLERKLALLESTLRAIAARFDPVSFRERVATESHP